MLIGINGGYFPAICRVCFLCWLVSMMSMLRFFSLWGIHFLLIFFLHIWCGNYSKRKLNALGCSYGFAGEVPTLRVLPDFFRSCFLFRQDFCYDHMTSQSQICFLFIRSRNINWIACVTSFFTYGRGFFSFEWLSFWEHVTYLNKKWLPCSKICFSLL